MGNSVIAFLGYWYFYKWAKKYQKMEHVKGGLKSLLTVYLDLLKEEINPGNYEICEIQMLRLKSQRRMSPDNK